MKVEEVMTKDVITLRPLMYLKSAAEILAKNNISGAPVVDNEGRVVGILTENDILEAVAEATDRIKMVYPSIHTMGVFFEMSKGEVEILKAFEERANTVVSDVMTTKVITCSPKDKVRDVARILVEAGVNRIPVVDEDERVVGIITRGDIIKAVSKNTA